MKFGVVTFPGSNCDEDVFYVLSGLFRQETVRLWHKDTDLQGCDFIVLPGGFSYGDYLRSGAIARFSPIMEEVIRFANRGGYVLGICNGFQILCEARLLEGTLLRNKNQLFICDNVFIRPGTNHTLLTCACPDRALKIPIAHGEGRYFAPPERLKKLQDKDQVIFRYCDELGNFSDEANVNGSLFHIAGITNEARNVFGMMPHPERAADEALGNTDGKFIFESILSKVTA